MFIVKSEPKSISAESYRNLRTNLEFSSVDNNLKTIIVTSSEAGEGKSTVAGNLAYALSQNEKNVLLIDCDLRKPALHKHLKIANFDGLTDYLVKKDSIINYMKRIEDKLTVITAGKIPPNPAEIISSNSLWKLIKEMEKNFDYIIIDTPPLRAVTDGQILAGKCDGTILVVRSGVVKAHSLKIAYEELKKVNANIVGTVMNGVEGSEASSYYYYYGHEGRKNRRKKKLFG